MTTTHLKTDPAVAIAGLGLIGGSLAKTIKKNTAYKVMGIDNDPQVLETALADDAIDEAGSHNDIPLVLEKSDLLILALSPEKCVDFMNTYGDHLAAGAVVTDVCGVKRYITEKLSAFCEARGLVFIGGHPMAGKEHSGYAHSDENLFKGCSYILTPDEKTDITAITMLKDLLANIGCGRITLTSPEHHDRMIAFTSQLPHVLAGAYVKSPASKEHMGYSAGSFRDVSRVACVDEGLWSELFLLNGDFLCDEIDILIDHLTNYRDAVANRESEALMGILRGGRVRKESLSNL